MTFEVIDEPPGDAREMATWWSCEADGPEDAAAAFAEKLDADVVCKPGGIAVWVRPLGESEEAALIVYVGWEPVFTVAPREAADG